MPKAAYDVIIAWTTVHGGSWHKLIALKERLELAGMKTLLLVSSTEPMGLREGLDYTAEQAAELFGNDVRILPFPEIREAVRSNAAGVFVFDAHENPHVPELLHEARRHEGAKTVQTCTLLADFSCHGADYLFVQHPYTFYFELDFSRSSWRKRLVSAGAVKYAGNIFFEPVVNTWTSDVRDRESFFRKYRLDPSLPMGLWLPDRTDGLDASYGQVLEAIRHAGMNAAVKMHPWEYKGIDDTYGGRTSAEVWDVPAIEEKDTSWAYEYCSLAVLRGSAVGIEMAVWQRPSYFIPHDSMQFWPEIYHSMMPGCSAILPSVEALAETLERDGIMKPSAADYREAYPNFIKNPRDSFAMHVHSLREVIDSPKPDTPIGSLRPFRKSYLGRVPFSWLKKRHWAQHVLYRPMVKMGLSPDPFALSE